MPLVSSSPKPANVKTSCETASSVISTVAVAPARSVATPRTMSSRAAAAWPTRAPAGSSVLADLRNQRSWAMLPTGGRAPGGRRERQAMAVSRIWGRWTATETATLAGSSVSTRPRPGNSSSFSSRMAASARSPIAMPLRTPRRHQGARASTAAEFLDALCITPQPSIPEAIAVFGQSPVKTHRSSGSRMSALCRSISLTTDSRPRRSHVGTRLPASWSCWRDRRA